jgi:hypothetical protein
MTEEPGHEFDNKLGQFPALSKIDDTHYLCVYVGQGFDGKACVLSVNPDFSITSSSHYIFESGMCTNPTVQKIDDSHYLCSYGGGPGAAPTATTAFVLTVDPSTYSISDNPKNKTINVRAMGRSEICQIDATHYLVQYSMDSYSNTYLMLLTVNSSNWTVSDGQVFEVAPIGQAHGVLGTFNSPDYMSLYSDGVDDKIYAVDIQVNTSDWTISKGVPITVNLNDVTNEDPVMVTIDGTNLLCIYTGDSDSYGVVFKGAPPVLP